MYVCGPPSHHSVPPGPTVTTRVCLRWQVVPSARFEALMQHYQAARFSKRSLDSRQAVKNPQQTECTTDDSRTGNAAAVQAQNISDMVTSMDLQRRRMTTVLPQWDLGIMLEALSKLPMNHYRRPLLNI